MRAWLLLEHLRLWRDWADDPSSPMYGLADLGRITLIGHSRGGEAVATAAAFDRMQRLPENAAVLLDAGFGIDAVVAIAPIEGMYEPAGRPTQLEDTSYLLLHGGLDGDVFWAAGLPQYERVSFTGERFAAKALAWLPDANHGQFNTVWGRRDYPGPTGAVFDTAAIMPPGDQRAAAGAAITAFLDGTLRGQRDRLERFAAPDDAEWAAAPGLITRYADSSGTVIAGFTEDADPATGTLPGTRLTGTGLAVWREEPVPLRAGDPRGNAAVLGWTRRPDTDAPALRITLPDGWNPPTDAVVRLDLADRGEPAPGGGAVADNPIDLTVELVDASGRTLRTRLSDHGGIPPAPRSRRFKAPLPEWSASAEPLAQTFTVPTDPGGADVFDPAQLRAIRLVFDRTPQGLILLEHLAIGAATP